MDLPIAGLSRAVLIGASKFTGLPALPAVRNNLRDLQAALTDRETGILTTSACMVVNDPESTGVFMRELRSATKQAEDLLLVYYAGHGIRHQIHGDRLYLAVRESDSDGLDGTAVPFAIVREELQQSMARSKVLILDCCYSGLAVGAMAGPVVHQQELVVRGTAVMTSCPRNRESLAPPGDRNTAFTGELISLLRQGSRIPGEPLTVYSAFRSVKATLLQRQLPEPMFATTSTGGDIVLRRQSRAGHEPLPRPALVRPTPKPIIRSRMPIVEPRTMPVVRPVPRPEPSAGPVPVDHPAGRPIDQPIKEPVEVARPRTTSQRIVRLLLANSGWLLLWILLAFASSSGIGGFAGAIFNGSAAPSFGGDLGTGIGGTIVGGICATILGIRMKRARRQGRPSLAEPNPNPNRAMSKVRTSVLIAIVVFVLLLMTIGPTGESTGPQTVEGFSSLAGTVAVECLCAWVLAACCTALYRRWRLRATKSAPPGTGDAPSSP